MERSIQIAAAQRLRALHDRRQLLLLPNAWDAASACMLARLGFPAVATTSGGVAWSLGWADGERLPLDEMLAAVARITRVTPVPVTVDFEGGYGASPDQVHANVTALIATGAVGINLEDGIAHARLRPIDAAAARIAAARAAANACGLPLVINARIDSWIVAGTANEQARIADCLDRARAYLAAGADCIYPIALAEPAVIGRLCSAIDAPVNIGARTGMPAIAELARLGVARVSTATRLATRAYAAARDAALAMRDSGHFDALDSTFGYADMQALFDAH
ncbi:MAG: isocitrate lyase/phosphoenolpyruvate mutase family protein [Dokdonella sp.]|uniref:isocitrate lyase/PEP mutase family protein n=1 Tax=Dokdonella sp. TaxID=2291710 RepID=UPI0025B84B05|nr:isocitrate lyase/phosphoenolpyruvate mutase family protein [Dokdonella sp.]MBX3700502.1 isocitrate lyase/phosphoenolpyruvate mutase family protein [Dokdonella sp.]